MTTYHLTARVMKYQSEDFDQKGIEHDVAVLAYRYIRHSRHLDEDEAGDFFSLYYPRIMALIKNFRYQGRPFEAYLYVSLRWNIIRYRRSIIEKNMEHQLYRLASFWELHQAEPPYSVFPVWKSREGSVPLTKTERKRILYLSLRESEYLNNAMIEEIVSYLQIDRRWFMNCVTALKAKTSLRRQRLDSLRRYRNQDFYRSHLLQMKLERCFDPAAQEELRKKIFELEGRLKKVNEKIRKAHLHPTNHEISEVLKVPKGTIDSGIFYLRKAYLLEQPPAKEEEEQYGQIEGKTERAA